MDILSAVTGAVRLAVDAPMLVIGFIIGMVVYNYLLKKNPTMLAKLIAAASADVQKLIASNPVIAAALAPAPAKQSDPTPAAAQPAPVAQSTPAFAAPVAVVPAADAPATQADPAPTLPAAK